jgi:hypothetical protein
MNDGKLCPACFLEGRNVLAGEPGWEKTVARTTHGTTTTKRLLYTCPHGHKWGENVMPEAASGPIGFAFVPYPPPPLDDDPKGTP